MEIKVTPVANQNLTDLDASASHKVITGIREHFVHEPNDPAVELSALDEPMNVFSVDDVKVLYRIVPEAGEDVAVVLNVIRDDTLSALVTSKTEDFALPEGTLPPSARVGQELVERLTDA